MTGQKPVVAIYTTSLSRFGSISSSVMRSMSLLIFSSVSVVILPSTATQSSSSLSLKEKNTSGRTALGINPKARWRRYSDTESPHLLAFCSMIVFSFSLTRINKFLFLASFITSVLSWIFEGIGGFPKGQSALKAGWGGNCQYSFPACCGMRHSFCRIRSLVFRRSV